MALGVSNTLVAFSLLAVTTTSVTPVAPGAADAAGSAAKAGAASSTAAAQALVVKVARRDSTDFPLSAVLPVCWTIGFNPPFMCLHEFRMRYHMIRQLNDTLPTKRKRDRAPGATILPGAQQSGALKTGNDQESRLALN